MLSKAGLVTLVPVKKFDRAVKFYTDTLGGKLGMKADEDGMSFASLTIGKAEFWLITPQKQEKRELAYSAFVVDDIKAEVDELKKKGVKFQRPEKMGPDSKIEGSVTRDPMGAAAFFKDSEGNLLMLRQAPQ